MQEELSGLVEQDYMGLTPNLEQTTRAFEFPQIELAVYRDRGYAQCRGVGHPQAAPALEIQRLVPLLCPEPVE